MEIKSNIAFRKHKEAEYAPPIFKIETKKGTIKSVSKEKQGTGYSPADDDYVPIIAYIVKVDNIKEPIEFDESNFETLIEQYKKKVSNYKKLKEEPVYVFYHLGALIGLSKDEIKIEK